MEMMDTDMKMKMTYLSKNPTIKDRKTYYLEIYPHLEKKLEELEPERFPLLWDYLFDRVINQYWLGFDFLLIWKDIAILHSQALEEFLLDFASSTGEGFDQCEFGSEDKKGFAWLILVDHCRW